MISVPIKYCGLVERALSELQANHLEEIDAMEITEQPTRYQGISNATVKISCRIGNKIDKFTYEEEYQKDTTSGRPATQKTFAFRLLHESGEVYSQGRISLPRPYLSPAQSELYCATISAIKEDLPLFIGIPSLSEWIDRYMRAVRTIKHHRITTVYTSDGDHLWSE